jgi:hypothetical protein
MNVNKIPTTEQGSNLELWAPTVRIVTYEVTFKNACQPWLHLYELMELIRINTMNSTTSTNGTRIQGMNMIRRIAAWLGNKTPLSRKSGKLNCTKARKVGKALRLSLWHTSIYNYMYWK